MNDIDHAALALAPAACTLPTTDRPLRLAEWDGLFTDAATRVRRTERLRATIELRPDSRLAARAADLSVRETQCCSFFTFAVTASGGAVGLDIAVSAEHAEVLDALARRAESAVDGEPS
jgi:hypothetical protein